MSPFAKTSWRSVARVTCRVCCLREAGDRGSRHGRKHGRRILSCRTIRRRGSHRRPHGRLRRRRQGRQPRDLSNIRVLESIRPSRRQPMEPRSSQDRDAGRIRNRSAAVAAAEASGTVSLALRAINRQPPKPPSSSPRERDAACALLQRRTRMSMVEVPSRSDGS